MVLVQARDLDSTVHAELLELNRGVEVEFLPDVLNEDRLGDLAVCPASLEHPLDRFSVYAPARLVHLGCDLLESALSIPEPLDTEVAQDLETVLYDLSTADSIDVAVVSEESPVLCVLLDVLDRRLVIPLVGDAELLDERQACFQLRGVRQLSRSYFELTTCSEQSRHDSRVDDVDLVPAVHETHPHQDASLEASVLCDKSDVSLLDMLDELFESL